MRREKSASASSAFALCKFCGLRKPRGDMAFVQFGAFSKCLVGVCNACRSRLFLNGGRENG
jgi:hypothetical protein